MPRVLTADASRLSQSDWFAAPGTETGETSFARGSKIVVRFARIDRRTSLLDDDPAWLEPLITRLTTIAQLPPNWDSYAAPQISIDAIRSAMNVMKFHTTWNTPSPEVVPMSSGGVQLEWHENGIDLEITCSSDGSIEFWTEDRRSSATSTGSVRRVSGELERAIAALQLS